MRSPELDYALSLCERLGMTLSELGQRMSSWEFSLWRFRDQIRAADARHNADHATRR